MGDILTGEFKKEEGLGKLIGREMITRFMNQCSSQPPHVVKLTENLADQRGPLDCFDSYWELLTALSNLAWSFDSVWRHLNVYEPRSETRDVFVCQAMLMLFGELHSMLKELVDGEG